MAAPFAASPALPGRRRLLLTVLLAAALLGSAVPGWAQGHEPGGIGGTGITGGEETGGIGGTGLRGGEETGGIGGTGLRQRRMPVVGYGPIQRFGSVFVNGREYAITARTLVTVDGQPAPLAALRVGDMARVQGVTTGAHAGLAHLIAVWQAIVGPVAAVGPDHRSFVVLGQQVRVTGTPLAVRVGDVVGVSGQRQADGTWVASRVTQLPATPRFRLETTVAGLAPGQLRLPGLALRAPEQWLAGLRPGDRVVASGVIRDGQPSLTGLAPRPVTLGAPGTLVEVHDYFQSVGGGRLVAPDGMVAIGAPVSHLSGLEAADIVGRVSPTGSIEVGALQVAVPEPPTETVPALEPHGEAPAAGRGAVEPTEPPGQATDADRPAAIEPPEIGEPTEPTEPDIEPPEIQVPEPQAPEPDIDAPEVEPPTDR